MSVQKSSLLGLAQWQPQSISEFIKVIDINEEKFFLLKTLTTFAHTETEIVFQSPGHQREFSIEAASMKTTFGILIAEGENNFENKETTSEKEIKEALSQQGLLHTMNTELTAI